MQHILANESLDFIIFKGRKEGLMITLYTILWYNLSKEIKNFGILYILDTYIPIELNAQLIMMTIDAQLRCIV